MNLIFLHPELLIIAPVIAIGGWFLLRKADKPEHIFTILDFWPTTIDLKAGHSRHKPDWPWVLILAAAVLAALAISSPRLHWHTVPAISQPHIKLQVVGRRLPGNTSAMDLFIKAPALNLSAQCHVMVTVNMHVIRRSVTVADLIRGIDITPVPVAPTLFITLTQAGRTLAKVTLLRSPGTQAIAAHFIGTPPVAFLRLIAAMRGIVFHGAISSPGIWFIHQRYFNPASLRKIQNNTMVLLGDTPGPGLTPGTAMALKMPQNPLVVSHGGLLQSVNPSDVLVRRLIQVRLGPSWHILMQVDGRPWLAERVNAAENVKWIWLAGQMDSFWSDWFHHASFVIFFANVISDIKATPGSQRQGNWWHPAATPAEQNHVALTGPTYHSINLNIFITMLVCISILIAIYRLCAVMPQSENAI